MQKYSKLTKIAVMAASFMPLIALAAAVDNVTPIAKNVLTLSRVLVTIVFVLSVVMFGWGIVKFVTAASDPKKLADAKQFLWYGVIGMAVGASLFGLVTFLQTYFGVDAGQLEIEPPTVL